jgi:hypothetical protein
MTRHERIVLDFRGGPRDGTRKDLGESTDGKWPTEYVIERWPSLDRATAGGGTIRGRYVRTGEWTADVDARVYVWRPEVDAEG